ncbi:MAG: hypothetical protein FDZ75_05630, partial [Actinobacteria bacterium]
MISIREVVGQSVTVVGGKKPRRLGIVHHVLFAPEGVAVVGFEVERPDLAMMIELKPLFLALDRVTLAEGGIEVANNAKSAWGSSAARRLGIDWDKTVVWQGMPALSESGDDLGV